MNPVARLARLLRGLFRRRREDDETAEELRFHLELEAEKNMRAGMPPGEARRRARLRLGGADGMPPIPGGEVWIPMTWVDDVTPVGGSTHMPSPGETRLERRGQRWIFIKGRLRNDIGLTQADANLDVIMADLAAAFPDSNEDLQNIVDPDGRRAVDAGSGGGGAGVPRPPGRHLVRHGARPRAGVHGPADRGASIPAVAVSTNYFDTLGVPLLQGRAFTTADTPESR